MRRNGAAGRCRFNAVSWWLMMLAAEARADASGTNTQQLECFAVDFDGNNENPGTNDNLDFIKCGGAGARAIKGMVEPDLDANDQPVLVADWQSRGQGLFHGPGYFKEWWNGGNTTQNFWIVLELEYRKNADKWVHDQRPFHPLKNMGFGKNNGDMGAYFSIRCTVDFVYRGGENFAFTGDDDVWIFINRKLRVDLGGLHTAMTGKVELSDIDCDNPTNPNADGCLQKGCRYPIHLFQADRCATGSNFYFETSLTPIREDEATGICPNSQYQGDVCEQDSHCWNNGPADGQMYCKNNTQGGKTCERRTSITPPPTTTACPASGTTPITGAACQCAASSQTNECGPGMYCYATKSDKACHSGPKGPSPGGATLMPCTNSGSMPVPGIASCQCAPSSQINECAGGNYCYTANGAAAQSCFPGPKPKPMPTCPVSETSKVFVMACKCDPASTMPECSPGKYCYGGKCHAGPKSSSSTTNFCTVSGAVAQSAPCRCAASATTDDCAQGKYCYDDACQNTPQPVQGEWCVVSGTDPVTGTACRCSARTNAVVADCDVGKWCYNRRGSASASCQDTAQSAEDAAAASANGNTTVTGSDGEGATTADDAGRSGGGGTAFDKGGLFGVEWLSPLILSVASGVVCCLLCVCLIVCKCMCGRKKKSKREMPEAGGQGGDGGKQEILPAGWTVTLDYSTGAPCYSNIATGIMQWDPPEGTTYGKRPPAYPLGAPELYSNPMGQAHGRTETRLPHGWAKDYDANSGEKYYYSEHDGTTRWEPPPGSVGGSAGGGEVEMTSIVPKVLQSHVRSGTVLPPGWGKDVDADGNQYYYHTTTGETAWEAPAGSAGGGGDGAGLLAANHERSETVLPAKWGKDVDSAGNKYYYHEDGTTSWEKPPGSV